MEKFNFVITDYKSVGLYSNEVNDIFHSKTGALKEAFDKFILPCFLKESFSSKTSLNILDICYGIGYNTKAAISIMPDNFNLSIDCLEYCDDFVRLSPFIYDSLNRLDISLFLFSQIKYNDFEFIDKLKNYEPFFSKDMLDFLSFIKKEGYISNPSDDYVVFLHNIYYKYIANSMKQDLNLNKYNKTQINFHIGDARIKINDCKYIYDVVFLDAFSPQKDPTLWTIDFLSLVKEKMNENSILVSYSKSTPFRSALSQLGFYVGKTFIDEVDMGTIASLDKSKIINPLTEYDVQLLNTRSGITYKDANLDLNSDEILINREIEQKNSNLISHTQFLKKYS